MSVYWSVIHLRVFGPFLWALACVASLPVNMRKQMDEKNTVQTHAANTWSAIPVASSTFMPTPSWVTCKKKYERPTTKIGVRSAFWHKWYVPIWSSRSHILSCAIFMVHLSFRVNTPKENKKRSFLPLSKWRCAWRVAPAQTSSAKELPALPKVWWSYKIPLTTKNGVNIPLCYRVCNHPGCLGFLNHQQYVHPFLERIGTGIKNKSFAKKQGYLCDNESMKFPHHKKELPLSSGHPKW